MRVFRGLSFLTERLRQWTAGGARPQHFHTYELGVILSFLRHMPVSTVTKEIGEHDTRVWRVPKYHVEEALKLLDFYSGQKEYDEKTLFDFENMALDFCNSTIKEMQKFGEMLVRNAVEIPNYFETKRTNAILEGFNSKISLIKNRVRGFRK